MCQEQTEKISFRNYKQTSYIVFFYSQSQWFYPCDSLLVLETKTADSVVVGEREHIPLEQHSGQKQGGRCVAPWQGLADSLQQSLHYSGCTAEVV